MTDHVENLIDRRRTIIIGTITAAHFLLTAAMLFLVGAASMSRFDGGGPSELAMLLLRGAFQVLTLPLVTPLLMLKIPDTGLWGWALFLANSALWGWAGWRLIRLSRIRRGARRPAG